MEDDEQKNGLNNEASLEQSKLNNPSEQPFIQKSPEIVPLNYQRPSEASATPTITPTIKQKPEQTIPCIASACNYVFYCRCDYFTHYLLLI